MYLNKINIQMIIRYYYFYIYCKFNTLRHLIIQKVLLYKHNGEYSILIKSYSI